MWRILFDFAFSPVMFSRPSMPSVQPLPARDDTALEKARLDAERAAIAESKIGGRRATIAAGGTIAADEQYGRGLAMSSRRASSSALGV